MPAMEPNVPRCPPGEFFSDQDYDCYHCSQCGPNGVVQEDCIKAGLPHTQACLYDPSLPEPTTDVLITPADQSQTQDTLMPLIIGLTLTTVVIGSIIVLLVYKCCRKKLNNYISQHHLCACWSSRTMVTEECTEGPSGQAGQPLTEVEAGQGDSAAQSGAGALL